MKMIMTATSLSESSAISMLACGGDVRLRTWRGNGIRGDGWATALWRFVTAQSDLFTNGSVSRGSAYYA